jgi:hypothetical protein
VEFEQVANELYGLAPGEFTSTRTDRAKEARCAGDPDLAKRIGALRRPTTSAWLANQLVRTRAEPIAQLVELGDAIREAQAELSGEELRRLSRRRGDMVAALVRDAEQLAQGDGQPVSPSTLEELTGTLEAALADPVASEALRAGRLTSALHYSGLGFDAAGAAPTGTARGGGSAPPSRRRGADRALVRADREVEDASALLDDAERALRDVRREIHDTEGVLKRLREEEASASQRVVAARKARTAALTVQRKAQRAAQRRAGQ